MTTLTQPLKTPAAPEECVGEPSRGLPTDPPAKAELFGVELSLAGPEAVCDWIMAAAATRRPGAVDFMPVHGLIEAVRDADHRRRINRFDVVACDGQPIRWALNRFHDARLEERVYGPDTMLEICRRCAAQGVGIYLYGGRPAVLEPLRARLEREAPGLRIVGVESPPFRDLAPAEDEAMVGRINASGAGVVMLGLGCPKQEMFAIEHRDRLEAVQMCVGAAFDFHAGFVRQAPRWMQRRGLEWLYRLMREPRRLWRRYLVTNTIFVALFVGRCLTGGRCARPGRVT